MDLRLSGLDPYGYIEHEATNIIGKEVCNWGLDGYKLSTVSGSAPDMTLKDVVKCN